MCPFDDVIITKLFDLSVLYLQAATMSFDDVLRKHVGEAGRYQVLVILATCIILIPDTFSNMEIIFTTITPEFWPQGWQF